MAESRAPWFAALQEAAEPLSRLKLRHSKACPFLFDGGCSCGVKEIERLVVVAREAANSQAGPK